MELHPALVPLGFLVGTWTGSGRGEYPTIDDFAYEERVTFGHSGKPFLTYTQATRDIAGNPLHTESGYLRPGGPGRAELLVAQPTGIVEVQEGPVEGTALRLVSTSVGLSATAKEVLTVERNLEVTGNRLHYRLLMSAVGHPHRLHLEATLERRTAE